MEQSKQVPFKDGYGKVVGYTHNFRKDSNGYTICDITITDPNFDPYPIRSTIDLWVQSSNPSPIIDRKLLDIMSQIREDSDSVDTTNEPIIVEVK